LTKTLAAIGIIAFLIGSAVAQSEFAIVEDSLPALNAGEQFNVTLHAKGGTPSYHWEAVGDLPKGIILSREGLLSGRPAKGGPADITIRVTDSASPARETERTFHPTIGASLVLDWQDAPKVNNDRIDGSVKVSNGSRDTFDLTVVIVAVATDTNRATAIGYQHFPLKPGTNDFKIPFGSSLPNGGYVVHADAIAEIAAKNSILRQRLQTPKALQVTVGP